MYIVVLCNGGGGFYHLKKAILQPLSLPFVSNGGGLFCRFWVTKGKEYAHALTVFPMEV